jgi:uncharacterized surface protein with fasciclin (FAS1) repeats
VILSFLNINSIFLFLFVLKTGQTLRTLQGEDLKISRRGDSVYVNQALISSADHTAANGIVHLIDGVLLPPSLGMS